jgi:tRNA-(ms[2]io[6]A)-hydroxylase
MGLICIKHSPLVIASTAGIIAALVVALPVCEPMHLIPEIDAFLGCRTPDAWVQAALADQETLLIDHKNCEFKAASTALSLMAKYNTHLDLINMMSRLAREELVHHEQVLRLMKRRKIGLRPLSAGRYASGLRRVVRTHEPVKLVDTLVVGAFIEARSCERFAALVPHLDEELGKFYHGLLNSEARHYQGYLKLAHQYGEAADVERVVLKVREAEAELINTPDVEFRFHSGIPA